MATGLKSWVFLQKIDMVWPESLQRNLQRFVSGQLLLGLFMATTLTPNILGITGSTFLRCLYQDIK